MLKSNISYSPEKNIPIYLLLNQTLEYIDIFYYMILLISNELNEYGLSYQREKQFDHAVERYKAAVATINELFPKLLTDECYEALVVYQHYLGCLLEQQKKLRAVTENHVSFFSHSETKSMPKKRWVLSVYKYRK